MISNFLNSSVWLDVEEWTISWTIGGTNWFPLLESIHVIAAAMVVGSILWVDLRLIGVSAVQYPITTMSRELVPWTWGAFFIAWCGQQNLYSVNFETSTSSSTLMKLNN